MTSVDPVGRDPIRHEIPPVPRRRPRQDNSARRHGRSGTALRARRAPRRDPAVGTEFGGDAARSRCATGPAQRHAAHSQSAMTSAGGPAPTTLANGSNRSAVGLRLDVVRDDPAPHPATGQRHAHERADGDRGGHRLGNEIVEGAIQSAGRPGEPGTPDPSDATSHRFTCRERSGERFGGLAEAVGVVGALPGEVGVRAAEVPVRRGLLVDRPAQVEPLDDRRRAQVEVLLDEARELERVDLARCRRSRPSPTPGGQRRSRTRPAPRTASRRRTPRRSWPRDAPRTPRSGRPSSGPCR